MLQPYTVPEGAKAAQGERQAACATVECLGEDCRCDSHSREGDPDDGFDRLRLYHGRTYLAVRSR